MILVLSIAGFVFALIPAAMFWANLPLFTIGHNGCPSSNNSSKQISVLIPARNEQQSIAASIEAALASEAVEIEVLMYDDHSTDATAEIVQSIAAREPRVRYIGGAALPAGWNGKQHACFHLARAASHSRLAFLDADVRLRPLGLATLSDYQERTGVALLSAFPHQQTGPPRVKFRDRSWLEEWIIPLMHYILLGFLPLARMRASTHPAYAAGCGQWFMTDKTNYQLAGTHEAIRSSRHDGLKLPAAYREAGLSTDVVDGTELAECRMYVDAASLTRGVLKNATEGIANPRLIVPFSAMLVGGSVLPVVMLPVAIFTDHFAATVISLAAVIIGHMPRAIAAVRFRQPISGVIFHSVATALFVGLQWLALAYHLCGHHIQWRGRAT